MTDKPLRQTEKDAIDRSDPVEDLLGNYHIIKYGNEGKSETDWWELAQAIQLLLAEARKDELERMNTGRHYGKDYQDSLDELDEYKDKRLAELAALGGKSDE